MSVVFFRKSIGQKFRNLLSWLGRGGIKTMVPKKKIYIGAAHSKENPGESAGSLNEYNISLDVHKGILEAFNNKVPAEILLEDLAYRIKRIRSADDVELVLEPHCNSLTDPKAHGYFCIIQEGCDTAEKYAKAILEEFKTLPLTRVSTGICYHKNGHCWFNDKLSWKREVLGLLQNTGKAAMIIEMCYLTNPNDARWISSMEHRLIIGNAIGRGIMKAES